MKSDVIILLSVSLLGFISVSNLIIRFTHWIWSNFFRPPKNLKNSYGSWAIITGSTDGIGKALAFQFASTGLHLILIGRNPRKLEETSNQIRQRSGSEIQIKTVVIDFAATDGAEVSRIVEEAIKGLDVGVLVNNAGFSYSYARFFHEVDSDSMDSVMKVNMDGATWVTRSVIPIMMKKKKGAIVNVGSGSYGGLCSYPLFAIYAASKAYLTMFSKCIGLEYKQHGIDIQCQIPLFVSTKMAKLKESFFVPSAKSYSKSSARWIGYENVCIPYWPHSLQWFIFTTLPQFLIDQYIFQNFLGMRKRGMAKDARKKAEVVE